MHISKGVEKQLNLNHLRSGSFQARSRNTYLSVFCLFVIASHYLKIKLFCFQCIILIMLLPNSLCVLYSNNLISLWDTKRDWKHFGSLSPGICSVKNHFAIHFINPVRSVFKLPLFLSSALPQQCCRMVRNLSPTFTIHLFTATLGPASSVIGCGVSHPPAFFLPQHIL